MVEIERGISPKGESNKTQANLGQQVGLLDRAVTFYLDCVFLIMPQSTFL